MVPHLTTSLTGPLNELERLVLAKRPEIERWFRTQLLEHTAPFYSSVDLRNSGFKLAPVDTNPYPGGFNNLNPDFMPLCVHAATAAGRSSARTRCASCSCPRTIRATSLPPERRRAEAFTRRHRGRGASAASSRT
jgi:hypothetical protein